MQKPKDYSKYFNKDGTKKECPDNIMNNGDPWKWHHRQRNIFLSQLSEKDRKMHEQARKEIQKRWDSEEDCTVFH